MLLKTLLIPSFFAFTPVTPLATPSRALTQRQADTVEKSIFFRRGYHSSVVLNDRVYIDGGEFSYLDTDNVPQYQYSNQLLSIDLSSDWTSSTVELQSISKPERSSLTGGGIWKDEKNGILYTGFAGYRSDFGDKGYVPQGLWSYTSDGSGSGTWENLNGTADSDFTNLPRPNNGQVASGDGYGFFLGGFYQNSKTPSGQRPRDRISGLVTFDFESKEATNETVSLESTGGYEQMGGMVYVPNFGEKGILVSLGGAQEGIQRQGYEYNLIEFSKARVYDVSTKKWFEQPTTGDQPPARKEFCAAGVASNSNTYEILIYAGWGGNLGAKAMRFDEAYVLTLPGFHWVKANYTAVNPRHGLSCNSVGGGQILTIGGVDSKMDGNRDGDLYKGVFDTQDPFAQGLGIFDLSTMAWKDSYNSSQKAYVPSPEIQRFYDDKGRKPDSGWASRELEDVFSVEQFTLVKDPGEGGGDDNSSGGGDSTVPAPSQTASPDPSSEGSSSSTGAIAGGVVGGVVGLALIAGLAWFLVRRRRRNDGYGAAGTDSPPPQEMHGNSYSPAGVGLGGGSPGPSPAGVSEVNSAGTYPGPYGYYKPAGDVPQEVYGGGERWVHELSPDANQHPPQELPAALPATEMAANPKR